MANRCSLRLKSYLTSGIILMVLLLGGCATQTAAPGHIAPLYGHSEFHVQDFDFHTVSPEMETFLDRYVQEEKFTDAKVWNLVWSVTDRNVFGFEYDPSLTLPPQETFFQRKGNCLAFSSMLVTMARHRGLNAWYQQVEIPPQWSNSNNVLLISMHVNVVLQGRKDEWVVDISGRERGTSRKISRMSDEEAKAQYFNNLGADALTEGDLGQAYAYFVKAIETEPGQPYLWSNLGVVYSRNEQIEDARRSYLTALKIDSSQSMAANNLYLIYESEGDVESASRIKAQVDRHRRKNPYYLSHLSSLAYEEGRFEDSKKMLGKAIRLNDEEYRFHYEMARSLAREGDMEAAHLSLERAVQLAPDEPWIGQASIEDLPALPE